MSIRTLALVLGDQLSHDSPVLAALDPARDAILMLEAPGEATHVWSHKARITVFLAAMRHFAAELSRRGFTVYYVELGGSEFLGLPDRLVEALERLAPDQLRMLEPGEWRLLDDLGEAAARAAVPLRMVPDPHFLCSRADFRAWASGYRGSLRMEFFYRQMRRTHDVLLDEHGEPEGGRWNFDAENRKGFGRGGPGAIPPPERIAPDAITEAVMAEVEARFPDHPGTLNTFGWPVTAADAERALDTFIRTRLPTFGTFQDAMWTGTPYGWHALISSALNLHLLDPRAVVRAAEDAYRAGHAPLASVEGFIRQILGWREFIRGVYWLDMPGLAAANHFGHERPLPGWFWTGETTMACASDVIGQTLDHGYAHHIQRLMVTGLFGLLAEIEPAQVADWYLAVYVDAVEWVELPNVAGMALFADGGRFTSKPYAASGSYIDRMSNYCGACKYAPTAKAAEKRDKPLCPLTALYWGFVDRHEKALAANPRTALMAKNLARLDPDERASRRRDADRVLANLETL